MYVIKLPTGDFAIVATPRETEYIQTLLGNVGGPHAGPRGTLDRLYKQLADLEVKDNSVELMDKERSIGSNGVYFK